MKKTLAVFALVAISVAVVVFTAVQGQNGGQKFRRLRAEKKIANQYIVVLKDDVSDVDSEAFRMKEVNPATPDTKTASTQTALPQTAVGLPVPQR